MIKIAASYLDEQQKRFIPKKQYAACWYSRLWNAKFLISWIVTNVSARNYTAHTLFQGFLKVLVQGAGYAKQCNKGKDSDFHNLFKNWICSKTVCTYHLLHMYVFTLTRL